MSTCNTELLHDYAFDELPAAERPGFERHLAECASCAAELDQLRLTTAALRVLPDREPPQRIAFVSDKVFAPSRFWNFAPWLGFASTGVMAVALIVSSFRRPAEPRAVTVYEKPQLQPVDEMIKRAVDQVRAEVQAEDARIFKAALAASELRYEQERRTMMDTMYVIQAHQNSDMMGRASAAAEGNGQ